MKKNTYGFQIETIDGTIHVTQDQDSAIVVSPHEVDALVMMLQEAQQELIPDKAKATSARKLAEVLKGHAKNKEVERLRRGH